MGVRRGQRGQREGEVVRRRGEQRWARPLQPALLGVVVAAGLATATGANAAAMPFAGQLSPASLAGATFSLTGNRLSGFSVSVRPTHCKVDTAPENIDDIWSLEMPANAHVTVSDGHFRYQGAATSDYGAGTPADPYGGRFTVSGTLGTDPSVVSGTVKLADAGDPYKSGCSGSYRLLALPNLPDVIAPINATAYQNKKTPFDYRSAYLHFNYAAGVIRNLEIDANFLCQGSTDDVLVDARTYGISALPTTAKGRFSLKAYVLDGYSDPVSLRFTGRVKGRKASGRIVIAEPPGGFEGDAGLKCSGNYAWTAAKGPL